MSTPHVSSQYRCPAKGSYVVALAASARSAGQEQLLAASVAKPSPGENSIEVLDAGRLKILHSIRERASGGGVSDLSFLTNSASSLLTCGTDNVAKLWDLRASSSQAQRDLRPSATGVVTGTEPLLSVSADCEGRLCACAVSMQVHMFDLASGKELFAHAEGHSQPISRLRFHPRRAHELVTAGEDGLICALDVRRCGGRTEEDDAGLRIVVNNEEGARLLTFMGEGAELLAATSTTEVLRLWCLHAQRPGALCGQFAELRGDSALRVGESDGYIVDVLYDEASGRAEVLAGGVDGRLALLHLNLEGASLSASLEGGHNEVVRTVASLDAARVFATGGEDGFISVWRRPEGGNGDSDGQKAVSAPLQAGRSGRGHARSRSARLPRA